MHTRIKICGMTREQDIQIAVEAGVDAIGLIFYAASPRSLTPRQANTLIKWLPPFVTTVGLFVNAQLAEISAVLEQVPLTCLQFHGDETPELCALVRENYNLPIIRAARMTPDLNLFEFADIFVRQAGCSSILLDTWVKEYGGVGKAFDWSLIPTQWFGDYSHRSSKTEHTSEKLYGTTKNKISEKINVSQVSIKQSDQNNKMIPVQENENDRPRLILSGGLHANNVIDAIIRIQPDAVDISSGVETEFPGIKDQTKIHAFINAVRLADVTKNNLIQRVRS